VAVTTLKLDQEQIYKVLRDFWDKYKQRDILGKFWESSAQVIDNEYFQILQANQSKSVITVPVDWQYQWLPFTFEVVESETVVHDHFFLRSTAAGGELVVALPGATDAQQVAVYLNGVYLTDSLDIPGVDYTFIESTQSVGYSDTLDAGDEQFITWFEIGEAIDRPHLNLFFEETLTGSKSSWTDAAGDAFDPAGQGSYDSGSTTDPIEVYVNGVLQPSSAYTETSDTVLDLSVSLVSGDHFALRWRREDATAEAHAHLRLTEVADSISEAVNLPFRIDPLQRQEYFWLNGVLLLRGVDYTAFTEQLVLSSGAQIDAGDLIEVEFIGDPLVCLCEIDPDIISIPVLQNGIDESAENPPTICLREGVDYIIDTGSDGTKQVLADQLLEGIFWAPDVFVNERAVENNFGKPINFLRDNSVAYRSATQGLWFAYWNGPSVKILEDSASILLGLPFSANNTTVTSSTANPDGTTTLVLADGTTHTIPNGLESKFNSGDAVSEFEALSTGVTVIDLETDPFWFRRISVLGALLGSFTADGLPVFATFDDGGSWDDGGSLDDHGTGPEILARNRRLFDALRHFVFLVDIEGPALNQSVSQGGQISTAIQDVTFFLDSIKPAYTRYLLDAEILFEDQYLFPILDQVTLLLQALLVESCNFDDGGFFDSDGPLNIFTAGVGQTIFVINATFPYTVGSGDLKVWVDGILQATPADYIETDSITITFNVGLTGGEKVVIYEDDSTTLPFDALCPVDEVTLVLA
jgi:hypothetical protein